MIMKLGQVLLKYTSSTGKERLGSETVFVYIFNKANCVFKVNFPVEPHIYDLICLCVIRWAYYLNQMLSNMGE